MSGVPGTAGLLLAALETAGSAPAQRWREDGAWRSRSGADLARAARVTAASLAALGVRPGDRVGLVADAGPWFLEGNLGILAAGAADVPRGTEAPPGEIARILEHSGAVACLCAGGEALRRVLATGAPGRMRFTARLDPGEVPAGVLDAGAFRAAGGGPAGDAALPPRAPGELAAVVYTSGTSGRPRGAALEHRSFDHQLRLLPAAMDLRAGDRLLTFLPPWHAYGRIVEYAAAAAGAEVVFTDRRRFREDLAGVAPTWMAAVPRVWERLRAGAAAAAAAAGHPRDPGAEAAALRRILGGALRRGVSGGSRLDEDTDRAYAAAGIGLLVGYGLTETGPVISFRRPGANRPGTMGPPLPGTEIRIVDRDTGAEVAPGAPGILRVRGPQVMRGYFGDPALTDEVLRDGWFETGDLVSRDPDGHLVFRGRAKDTLVLRGGEKIEPGILEDRVACSPFVEHVVAVGQDRKTAALLVAPAREVVEAEWRRRGAPLPVDAAAVEALIRGEVERLLTEEAGFRPWERRPRVALLPEPLTVETGCLTATGKVRRREVEARYAALVDRIYEGDRAGDARE